MSYTKIEWTDRTWNPLRGCTRVSPGCVNCYAEAIAGRFSAPGQPFHGFAERTSAGARWTGEVDVMWDRVDMPLRWRKPVKIFANSTNDFFHEALIQHDVAGLFGVMIAAHHLRGHIFQVLTKRANQMRAWLSDPEFWIIANSFADDYVMARTDPLDRRRDDARATLDDYGPDNPPPGIWLGVSVEDKQRADERVPDLLATPAAVRWLSCEPLLGPVDLGCFERLEWQPPIEWAEIDMFDAVKGEGWVFDEDGELDKIVATTKLDWVVAGGESGRDARGSTQDVEANMRSLLAQCRAAGVAFFGKQNFKKQPLPDDLLVREFPHAR